MKILRVVLIPPNGQLKKHDFSFQRIEKWLSKFDNIETTLLHIKPLNFTPDISIFKSVIEVKNEEELFDILNRLDFSFIFHEVMNYSEPHHNFSKPTVALKHQCA